MDANILESPIARRLCERCAKFNWLYHLTRFFPDHQRNEAFRHEDLVVKQVIRNGIPHHADGLDGCRSASTDRVWYQISNPPYSGAYFVNDSQTSTYFNHGSLPSLTHSIPDCSVCNLLLRAVEGLDPQHVLGGSATVWFCNPKRDLNPDPHVLVVLIYDKSGNQVFRYGRRFTLLGDGSDSFSRPILNVHQTDLAVIKKWWQEFKTGTGHENCCRSSAQNKEASLPILTNTATSLRVIDVSTDRVIVATAHCEYIALSYVWGNCRPFTLRKADLVTPRYSTRSSGTPYAQLHRQQLPHTIRDAMAVVEALGERYLWVDCLCIVQDDEEEKATTIHAMDQIYKAATLTIVAASGKHAHSGLPGLHPGSRYIRTLTGSIEGVGLVEIEPPFSLETSIWATRGWTYQEYQFSKRCLIFLDGRVFFECLGRLRTEARPTRTNLRPTKTRFADFGKHVGGSAMPPYFQHVEAYSQRALTYQEDILNAFAAILEDYAIKYSTRICWGLPVQHFLPALLWANGRYWDGGMKALKRRLTSQKTKHPFPSWSWAGWLGPITFDVSESPVHFGNKVEAAVAWPWDANYDMAPSDDVFETGILTIKVDSVVLDRDHLSPNDVKYCRFNDGRAWDSGTVECFLLGRISDEVEAWKTNERIKHNYILMAVKRHENGIYYKEGLFRLDQGCWTRQISERKSIRLG